MYKSAAVGRVATVFLLQILLILAASLLDPAARCQPPGGDRVAVVNGEGITRAEFRAALQQAQSQAAGDGQAVSASRTRALKKKVLENLIGRRLAYQESQQQGLLIDAALVDREVARVLARVSDASALDEILAQNKLSRARLQVQFQQDLAIRRLLAEQVLSNIEVTDQTLRDFYDNHPNLFKTPALVKASHIFIPAGPDTTREERKEAVALIKAIQTELDQGVPFSDMALDYSQCPSSDNGGDLGYFDKEKMIKGFAEAAFALDPGEISDIVRTGRGYHLIKVEARKPKTKLSFEEVKTRLLLNLKMEKSSQQINTYLKTLRDQAEIEIFLRF